MLISLFLYSFLSKSIWTCLLDWIASGCNLLMLHLPSSIKIVAGEVCLFPWLIRVWLLTHISAAPTMFNALYFCSTCEHESDEVIWLSFCSAFMITNNWRMHGCSIHFTAFFPWINRRLMHFNWDTFYYYSQRLGQTLHSTFSRSSLPLACQESHFHRTKQSTNED